MDSHTPINLTLADLLTAAGGVVVIGWGVIKATAKFLWKDNEKHLTNNRLATSNVAGDLKLLDHRVAELEKSDARKDESLKLGMKKFEAHDTRLDEYGEAILELRLAMERLKR